MSSRRLSDLDKEVYLLAEKARLAWENVGIDILVTCTYRSNKEQEALYAQGRDSLPQVNLLRLECGMHPLTEKENKRIVTCAKPGQSLHNKRRAFDVVPLVGGKCVWDASATIWQDVGQIGESVGLEWAGRWTRFKEMCHFQLR